MKKNFTYLFTSTTLLLAGTAYAQPANDNVADAILLSVDGSVNVYSNVDGTAEANEVFGPDGDCGGTLSWCDGIEAAENSIWFTFVAPLDGIVTITGCDPASLLDSQFAVWEVGDANDFATFNLIGANDDNPNDCVDDNAGGYSSFLELCDLTPGQTYYLQVDGYATDANDIAIILVNDGVCAGATQSGADNACDAILLNVDGSVSVYSNIGATVETGEVAPAETDGNGLSDWFNGDIEVQNSIWFKFEAPASGVVLVSTCNPGDSGDDVDTQIAVWSNNIDCDYANFIQVAANDDYAACAEGGILAALKSNVYACGLIEGNTYYLQIDGYEGAEGDIAVSLTESAECVTPTATVQVVHNSADLAAAVVDVYANGELLIDNFAFRTATPYVTVAAATDIVLTINDAASTDSSNALYSTTVNLVDGSSNLIFAQGLVSASGYNTSVNTGTEFLLLPITGVLEAWDPTTEVGVAVIHGSTDAPTVDVQVAGASILDPAGPISYNGVFGYFAAPVADIVIDITTEDGSTIVASFDAPLATLGLGGQTINVFASGFLDPSTNSDGPAFGLCVALANGDVVCLNQIVGLKENESISGVSAYPNPAKDNLTLNFNLKNNNKVSIEIYDVLGNVVLAENFGQLTSGQNRKEIQLNNLASGLYNMNLLVDGTVLTQKIQVIK